MSVEAPGDRPHPAVLSELYDVLPIGIVETDLRQRIVRCNAAFAAMVGAPAHEVVGCFGWDFLHPDSAPADPAAVADLLAGRRSSYSVERLLRGPDGTGLAVKTDWALVRGREGRVDVLVCAVTDVSVMARTAEELRQARERADVLWQVAPVGILECGPDGVIGAANPALGALLGRRPDELVGMLVGQLSDPDGAPAIERTLRGLVRSGVATSAERRYLGADGRSIPVHVSAALTRDELGGAERVTAFIVDVTEADTRRVALADALAEIAIARNELVRQQHFTDALLETIDVGIVACDADGESLIRNGAERRLLGLTGRLERSGPGAIAAAASLIDVLDATGARVDPEHYPLARALRGEDVSDDSFRVGPRGGPLRDVVMRGSRITAPDGTVLGAAVAITDVTVERTALRELASERERLDRAQRLGQIGSFTYDPVTDRYSISPEMYRIWGLTPDADLIALWRSMVHPEDLTRMRELWQSALHAGGEHHTTYRIVRGDGSTRHLRVSMEIELDPAGHLVRAQGTHLDVTELTVARLKADEANALFSAILAATPDFTFVTDVRTGAVVYGSPGRSILGLGPDRLEAFGPGIIAGLVHPDDQPRLTAANLAARDLSDGAVVQLRYQARHVDGSWHWLHRRVTPFRRDAVTGQVTEVVGVVGDVTDEYETELALRGEEARFRALVTQVMDYAILGLDPDGVIDMWNDGAQRVMGYTADQAVGAHFSIFHTEQDREAGLPGRLLGEARARGRVQSQGWRLRADGTRFWVDAAITAVHDADGLITGFVKVSRDLTTQNRLEKAQESLFAAVTHDLKTPIIAIKMLTELMGDVDEATRLDYSRRIAAKADHLGELVNGLFEYAKIRGHSPEMSLEPLTLGPFVQSIVDGVVPALRGHRVTVEPSSLTAWADRTALERILQNLLANAAQYSPDGSPITVTFDASRDVVRLLVTDEGRGIAPEDLETIFDEFNRGRLGQDDGGTGLGLASVQRLAEQQGGRTWIDSELDRGTTVTVELARASDILQNADQSARPPAVDEGSSASSRSR